MSEICPAVDVLRAFSIGDLEEGRFSQIALHVAGCPNCEAALEQFDDHGDGLLSELKVIARQDTTIRSPIPEDVMRAAKLATGNGSSGTSSNVHLDPGRAYARRLSDGPIRLGRFELRSELGDGSFGYVFRARDLELDRDVAVKVGRAGALAGDEEVSAFLREARAAAQLSHPSIVAIHDSGQTEDGVCFLVSEFIEGETLERRLLSETYQPRQAAELTAELADALAYAHRHNVIHRDIKPSNIIIDHEGHPHVADFGLAKQLVPDRTISSEGRVMGTPAYMSPEQARGLAEAVHAPRDIYGLAVVLYALLTGARPFHGGRRLVLLQVLEDEPRPPRGLNDRIPKDLETICLKAMAKSSARRYTTADELAKDLRRYLAGEPISARPVGRFERLGRWCRRYPLAASVMIAVFLGSVIGFAYLSRLSTWFVRETALDSARMEADMLERINAYYSEEVVGRLDWKEVQVTHEYTQMKNALPLPATFTIDAGERISEGTTGMQVRLYSDYPWRENGGPKDGFERTALDELRGRAARGEADLSYHAFTEKDHQPVVRYSRAQIMKDSCVKCHNNDERSPKRDWQVGDVAGVLSITRPLEGDIARTRSGLRGAFLLVAGIAGTLAAVSLVFLLRPRVEPH